MNKFYYLPSKYRDIVLEKYFNTKDLILILIIFLLILYLYQSVRANKLPLQFVSTTCGYFFLPQKIMENKLSYSVSVDRSILTAKQQ
jgi:hypothetical protein